MTLSVAVRVQRVLPTAPPRERYNASIAYRNLGAEDSVVQELRTVGGAVQTRWLFGAVWGLMEGLESGQGLESSRPACFHELILLTEGSVASQAQLAGGCNMPCMQLWAHIGGARQNARKEGLQVCDCVAAVRLERHP
jgi:hypothetical protein